MGEGKLRERGEDKRGGEGREEEDRHGQRWEMKLLALWDARLSSLPHSVNGIPSFHFGQLLVPHYVADAIHFLGLSLSSLHLGVGTERVGLTALSVCRGHARSPSHSRLPLTIRKFRSQRKFFYDSSTSKIGASEEAVIFASRMAKEPATRPSNAHFYPSLC